MAVIELYLHSVDHLTSSDEIPNELTQDFDGSIMDDEKSSHRYLIEAADNIKLSSRLPKTYGFRLNRGGPAMTKAQLQGKSPKDEKDNLAAKVEKRTEHGQESPLLPPHLLIKAPSIATASNIQAMQRVVGNRAVQRAVGEGSVVQRHATASGFNRLHEYLRSMQAKESAGDLKGALNDLSWGVHHGWEDMATQEGGEGQG